MTTATRIPLVKTRDHTVVVKVSGLAFPRHSDAEWATAEGHRVYRTTNGVDGNVDYWVKDLTGRWSCQDTLDDVRKDIAWLREHGR